MKQTITNLLKKYLKNIPEEQISSLIEIPPSSKMGDYSFPCFTLSKKLKKEPSKIALELKKSIKISPELEKIEVSGPYLNFFLNKIKLAEKTISEILKQKENYGKHKENKKTVLIEFSSPNIAKPFGIGHLRSTIIGNSLSRISEFNGYKVIRMNYLGDWGTQFGKIIFGYKKFGKKINLKSKDSMKKLLEIYVKANKEDYKEQTRNEFNKLESGDKEDLFLWKKFKEISLKNFKEIYKLLNVKFDVYSGESFYNNSLDFVLRLLKNKKLLQKSQGALIVNLEKYGLGISLIQKTDGTTIYLTRDLAAAIERHSKYKFNKMIYEVGQEQTLHFKQLFKILELLGYKWAKNCIHASHGLYLDKDRKKFSTRKGKTIFMQDILNETINLAEKEIKKRFPKISKKQLEQRALNVARAAIFYGDLKNNLSTNIIFDIKKFISFEGDTGPYIQYSYARASSILKKIKTKNKNSKINSLEKTETKLIKKLSQFPDIVSKSCNSLNPSLIANYSYQLAQTFNEFYHACPVIGSKEKENFRINIIKSFRYTLKNALYLLGINAIEEM